MARIILTFLILVSVLTGQQIFRSGTVVGGATTQAVYSDFHAIPTVTGAPYSADRVGEHNQTLANGTHIHETWTSEHIARDSQGRVRIERPLFPATRQQSGPTVIQISDPISGVGYIFDEQNKVAHRVVLKPGAEAGPPPEVAAEGDTGPGTGGVAVGSTGVVATTREIHPNQPERSSEQLGTKTIEGVVAQGRRATVTWPVGSQGNDRPLVTISENWYSQELRTTVLSKNSNPRSGDNISRLTNISRAEPDASLFQPPPGYTIVDDKDSVTLTLKRQ